MCTNDCIRNVRAEVMVDLQDIQYPIIEVEAKEHEQKGVCFSIRNGNEPQHGSYCMQQQ